MILNEDVKKLIKERQSLENKIHAIERKRNEKLLEINKILGLTPNIKFKIKNDWKDATYKMRTDGLYFVQLNKDGTENMRTTQARKMSEYFFEDVTIIKE